MTKTISAEERWALIRSNTEEVERAVLAGVIVRPDSFNRVREIVTSTGFVSDRHREIWQAIESVMEEGHELDLTSVRFELSSRGKLEDAGGTVYLSRLLDEVIVAGAKSAHVEDYARRLADGRMRTALLHSAARLNEAAGNGKSSTELAALVEAERARIQDLVPESAPLRLTPLRQIEPEGVDYAVRDFLRRKGLSMLYAPAGSRKTYFGLRICAELLSAQSGTSYQTPPTLFGHPQLTIQRPWNVVVWVAAEESAGVLRNRWDAVLAGMELTTETIRGELLFLSPMQGRRWITIDRVEAILDAAPSGVDAVILDSWTSLVPLTYEGQKIEWDRDNFATRRLLNVLRGIANERAVNIIVVHHTGKASDGPRGPSEFSNSVDTLLKLEKRPEGRALLTVEKQRDGADGWSIPLAVTFRDGAVQLRHEERPETAMPASHASVLAFLRGSGRASVSAICEATGLARSTVQRALGAHEVAGAAFPTGEKTSKGSPIWSAARGAHEVPTDD